VPGCHPLRQVLSSPPPPNGQGTYPVIPWLSDADAKEVYKLAVQSGHQVAGGNVCPMTTGLYTPSDGSGKPEAFEGATFDVRLVQLFLEHMRREHPSVEVRVLAATIRLLHGT
jgi:hypothetical protein